MSDILPPLSGPTIDKHAGKGAVMIVTDEVVIGLCPVIFNNVPNCIHFLVGESAKCADVGMDTTPGQQMAIIRDIARVDSEGFTDVPLTAPLCHRSPRNAWNTAADMLEALAKAARAKAITVSDDCNSI